MGRLAGRRTGGRQCQSAPPPGGRIFRRQREDGKLGWEREPFIVVMAGWMDRMAARGGQRRGAQPAAAAPPQAECAAANHLLAGQINQAARRSASHAPVCAGQHTWHAVGCRQHLHMLRMLWSQQPHHMCLSISSRSCSALAPVIMATWPGGKGGRAGVSQPASSRFVVRQRA